MSDETGNAFPGLAEDKTSDDGMSVEDAVASAYDDHDRAHNGIAEGEREHVGRYLKGHADAAGTTVKNGLNTLINTAATLRHGDMETKRQVIGRIVDDYGVQPMPMAEPELRYNDAPNAEHAGAGHEATPEEQLGAVTDFIAQNPLAQDDQIKDMMLYVLNDMADQGFEPNLETAYKHAVEADPRFRESARRSQAQAREGDHLARAKAASVQVAGGGNTAPSSPSDDLDSIIRGQL